MSTDLGAAFCGSRWSEEYDCVPLHLRLKILRERARKPDHGTAFLDQDCKPMLHDISLNQNEDGDLMTENKKHSSEDISMKTLDLPNNRASNSVPHSSSMDNNASDHSVGSPGNSDQSWGSTKSSLHSAADVPDVKIPLRDSLAGSSCGDEHGSKVKHEILYEFDDNLDTVVLGERRRMLESRKLKQSSGSYMAGNNGRSSNLSKVERQDEGIEIEMQKSDSVRDILTDKNIIHGLYDRPGFRSNTHRTNHTINKRSPTLPDNFSGAALFKTKASPTTLQAKSVHRQEVTMKGAGSMAGSLSSLLARVKDEPLDISDICSGGKNFTQNLFSGDAMAGSVTSLLPRVKDEPVHISGLCSEGNNAIKNFTGDLLPVKSEPGLSEFLRDELDHMPLIDRIKLLSSETPSLDEPHSVEYLHQNMASALNVGTDVLESVKPISISRPRKRRKTATNSIETALEEDAPELLKVLMERGVSIEEIKLYGEEESEDVLDDSLSEGGFEELEAVISQLFSHRQSILKFPLLGFAKGAKASYCLSCLLALVEQTSYLRHRKWPVEWGWCRDLQSFIFVFQRHNRIVLERPEYGFATYFFELLNSVPIDWQIKRLVTAMKLTNCGRITLIENKPLAVGEDLSEGEARVLAEYGWTPNTGLGTMLNFCDRVVHDRKQDMNSIEWRSKIGTQLMNGYNGGNIGSKNLPKKLVEYQGSPSVQVKLEQ